jgi:hypothetical protein
MGLVGCEFAQHILSPLYPIPTPTLPLKGREWFVVLLKKECK